MVERSAVNRLVVGSNPTSGAIFKRLTTRGFSSRQDRSETKCQRICQQIEHGQNNSCELCQYSASTP